MTSTTRVAPWVSYGRETPVNPTLGRVRGQWMPKRCDLRIEQKLEALHVLRVVCELCIEHSLDAQDSSVGHGLLGYQPTSILSPWMPAMHSTKQKASARP
jgi:hypothetical protein